MTLSLTLFQFKNQFRVRLMDGLSPRITDRTIPDHEVFYIRARYLLLFDPFHDFLTKIHVRSFPMPKNILRAFIWVQLKLHFVQFDVLSGPFHISAGCLYASFENLCQFNNFIKRGASSQWSFRPI